MTLFAPLFLLGLLGILLPLWLHRMNRSDPPAQPFSSVLLLRHSDQITSSERSLRYWLLLALRILALVLLALLFTQPAFLSNSSENTGPAEKHLMVVMDMSLSMQASDRWQQAVAAAKKLVNDLQPGETAQILGADATLQIYSEATPNQGELVQALDRLRPGTASLDFGQTVGALDELAKGFDAPTEIHLFSDLQATNLPNRFSDLVPSRSALVLHQPTSTTDNLSLTAQWSTHELVGQISNRGIAKSGLVLSFSADGVTLDSLLLDLEENQTRQFSFATTSLPRNARGFKISVDADDALSADNSFYLAPQDNQQIRMLLLAGNASLADTLYLETALASLSNLRVDQQSRYGAGALNFAADDYSIIIANDAGTLSQEVTTALSGWVERGGNLIMVAGPAVRSGQTLAITGHEILAADARASETGILLQQAQHPALARLGRQSLGARLYDARTLTLQTADVVIASNDRGLPWLVEQKVGSGRVLIFSQSLLPNTTDLSLTPEFVPLLRSLIAYLGDLDSLPKNYSTGDRILVGAQNSDAASLRVQQLFLADNKPLLSLAEQGGTHSYSFEESGVYGLQTVRELYPIAVNTPPSESLLEPLDPDIVDRWQALGDTALSEAEASAVTTTGTQNLPEWKTWEGILLPLLLLLLAAETFFANAHLRVRRETSE